MPKSPKSLWAINLYFTYPQQEETNLGGFLLIPDNVIAVAGRNIDVLFCSIFSYRLMYIKTGILLPNGMIISWLIWFAFLFFFSFLFCQSDGFERSARVATQDWCDARSRKSGISLAHSTHYGQPLEQDEIDARPDRWSRWRSQRSCKFPHISTFRLFWLCPRVWLTSLTWLHKRHCILAQRQSLYRIREEKMRSAMSVIALALHVLGRYYIKRASCLLDQNGPMPFFTTHFLSSFFFSQLAYCMA